jgi:phytoene synthase
MNGSIAEPQEITAASQSNFALSFWFLPKARRRGIVNFYALSRVVDDAVDDHGAEAGGTLLAFWKKEIDLCYQGNPTHPVTRAMQGTIGEFNIPKNHLDLLIEGCEWDLKKKRYETFEELQAYCYRVASSIGLVCMKIFGLEGHDAEAAAAELGMALQLTNILRDIKTDAARGRIYIPREDLNRYRLSEAELVEGKGGAKLQTLLKLMADRAETCYHRAFTKMRPYPRRPLLAAWIMGRVYYRLLQKIRERHYDVFSKKITVAKFSRIKIAAQEYCKGLFS